MAKAAPIVIPGDGYLTCAQTAKLVRAALRAAFPGVKFSVRSDRYSGGASIDVSWTDGPTSATVEKVTDPFAGGDFDGMTDSMSYHSTLLALPEGDVREVHFGADFVFCTRHHSDALLDRATVTARELVDGFDPEAWYPQPVHTDNGTWPGGGRGEELLHFIARHITA